MPPMASTSTLTTARSTATSNGCARSSRSSTANLPRSRPSMALDTGTAIANAAPSTVAASGPSLPAGVAAGQAGASTRHLRKRRISPLTLRILAVNVLALALLGIGLLFLGQYESSLIHTELQPLKTHGAIFAPALRA